MPRDNDKNNDSRGRRDRPSGGKGRSGAARGPEKKFAKRGFAGKSDGARTDGERRPYASKPDGARPYREKLTVKNPMARSRMRVRANHTPAGVTARRRAVTTAMLRAASTGMTVPAAIGPSPIVRSPIVLRAAKAKSAPIPRAAIARIITATTARPVAIAVTARPAARFSDKKFGDRKPYTPREGGGEKRPYTPRGEGFRKDGDRPRGDRPFPDRPSRGDRPERKFGGDKKFSRGAPDRGPRKDFGSRPDRGRDRNSDFERPRRFKAVAEARRQFARPCRAQFPSAARWREKFRPAAF